MLYLCVLLMDHEEHSGTDVGVWKHQRWRFGTGKRSLDPV